MKNCAFGEAIAFILHYIYYPLIKIKSVIKSEYKLPFHISLHIPYI
jgi:hypothetical protein